MVRPWGVAEAPTDAEDAGFDTNEVEALTSVHEASIFARVGLNRRGQPSRRDSLDEKCSCAQAPSSGRAQRAQFHRRGKVVMVRPSLSILPGTVEFLALGALAQGGRMHGFEVLRWIGETTDGELLPEEGALYPALHRMERRGWLRARWGISEKGRRAKYYEVTPRGRTALSRSTREWNRYVSAVGKVVIASEGA
jgi:transcriptional regulator